MDAIKAISYFFHLSPKRQQHLKKNNGNFPEVTRKKYMDVCRTRQLENIDGVNLFEDSFHAILMTLEDILKFLTWKVSIISKLSFKINLQF